MTIKDEIDPIGVAALIIALMSAFSQLLLWARGAQVQMLGPSHVVFYSYTAANGKPIVRLVAPLAYANTAPTYGAILAKERAILSGAGFRSEQWWVSFGRVSRENGQVQVTPGESVQPSTIGGQSTVAHTTVFAPLTRDCGHDSRCNVEADYIAPAEFGRALQVGQILHVSFAGELFGGQTLAYGCDVKVNENMVAVWRGSPSPSSDQICRPS